MKTKQFCCTHSIFLINTEHLTLGSFHWIYFNWFFFWTYTHGIVCSSTGFHLFLFFQPGAHWYENICPSTLFHSAIRTMGKQNLNGKTLRIHLTHRRCAHPTTAVCLGVHTKIDCSLLSICVISFCPQVLLAIIFTSNSSGQMAVTNNRNRNSDSC